MPDAQGDAAVHFLAAQGAHPDLEQRQAQVGHGAAHHRRVTVGRAAVAVAQVGVGVELEYAKSAVLAVQRPQRAQGHGVLAAQQHGQAAVGQGRGRGRLDAREHRLRPAGTVHGGRGVDAKLGGHRFAVPQFQLVRCRKNGRRPRRGAPAVGDTFLVGYGNHMKTRLAGRHVVQFRGQEAPLGVPHGKLR